MVVESKICEDQIRKGKIEEVFTFSQLEKIPGFIRLCQGKIWKTRFFKATLIRVEKTRRRDLRGQDEREKNLGGKI